MAKQTEEKKEGAALAVAPKVYGFHPETVNDAWGLAVKLSRSRLIPKPLQDKPEDLLVVMMTGHDLGLSPVQSIRLIHVIEGKGVCSAELMRGLVLRSGICEYLTLTESDEKKATFETKRRGQPEPTTISYTIEEAQRAGLAAKDNYRKHPTDMLIARASARIARAVYADLVGGLYVKEEEDEIRGDGREDTIRQEVSIEDVVASTDKNRGHEGAMPAVIAPPKEPDAATVISQKMVATFINAIEDKAAELQLDPARGASDLKKYVLAHFGIARENLINIEQFDEVLAFIETYDAGEAK